MSPTEVHSLRNQAPGVAVLQRKEIAEWQLSALGQNRTYTPQQVIVRSIPNSDCESDFSQKPMSALPPKADICGALVDVR
jgi:hypothetical protein